MAAAAVAPMSSLSLNGGTVLPPSAVSQNSPRHGRSRAASIAKGRAAAPRTRGHTQLDERDTAVSQALALVLRRSAKEDEGSDDGKLAADAEGWVDLDDVVSWFPHLELIRLIEFGRLTVSDSWHTPRSHPWVSASPR